MTLSEIVAKNIRERREAMGIGRTEFAAWMGTNYSNLSIWERGVCMPDAQHLCMLADEFECSVDELLGRK